MVQRYFNNFFLFSLCLLTVGSLFADQQAQPELKPVPETGSVNDYTSYIYELQFFRFAAQDEQSYREFVNRQSSLIVEAANRILQIPELQETEALSAANLKFERQQILFQDAPEKFVTEMEQMIEQIRKRGFDLVAQSCADRLLGWEFQNAVSHQDVEQFNKLLTKLDKWLDDKADSLTIDQVQLVQSICQISAYLDSANLQPVVFQKYGSRLAHSSDATVAHIGKSMLGARRRWDLPGKSMTINGKKLDGSDFDYSAYAGKVVLVEFWATWCGPCCGEIPHLKRMYEKYHDRGFEIVAISLDRDLNDLVQFIDEREVPWVQLPAYDTSVENQPLTEYYGISSIPVLILVGRDGKVISVEARGKVLEQLLAEQFPEEKQE